MNLDDCAEDYSTSNGKGSTFAKTRQAERKRREGGGDAEGMRNASKLCPKSRMC